MDRNEVEKRVVKVVCRVLGAEPEMVRPESNFVFDLGAESTQSVELVAAFEHEFGIEMDEDAALEVQTVGAATEFHRQTHITHSGDRFMEIIVKENVEEMSRCAARVVARTINSKPNAVLGLATGSTPLGLYKELVRMHKDEGLDFSQVTTFNLDEYVGLTHKHPQSYHYFMYENLLKHINVPKQNIYIPSGTTDNYAAFCAVVRAADRGVRRHRPANPGHRLRRPHRLQRADQFAGLADPHQDPRPADH